MKTILAILAALLAAICFLRVIWLVGQPPVRENCLWRPKGFWKGKRK